MKWLKLPILIPKWQHLLAALCLTLSPLSQLTISAGNAAILEQHDEATIYAVLADEVPELMIKSVKIISSGWDNLVADVNGEWIFRFPRLEEFVSTLKRESLLLERLQKCVSMPVPHYEFVGARTAFVGYRKILGEALDEKTYLSLSTEVRQQIAESLALFLSQLHSSVNVEEALHWGYKKYHTPLQWIETSLLNTFPSGEMNRIVEEALKYAKQNPSNNDQFVLLHNDLHGENFAFDRVTQQVAGVFDFSDAAVGEYYIEFGRLFSVHPDLAIRTSEAYARMNDTESLVKSAAADTILRRAMIIFYARECGNVSRELGLVQMLLDFVPVWDSL